MCQVLLFNIIIYGLYDYDRVDKNWKKRELHVDKNLDVVRMKSSAAPHQLMRVLKYHISISVNDKNEAVSIEETISNEIRERLGI